MQILVIDDELPLATSLKSVLEEEGYSASVAATGEAGLHIAGTIDVDIVICDIRLPDRSGLEVLEEIRRTSPGAQVIMITAYANLEDAIDALKLGARDYIIKPFLFEDLLHRIRAILSYQRLEREAQYLRRSLSIQEKEWDIIGESAPMHELRGVIERVAPTNSTALICGESGTGKELVARTIHKLSGLADGPFIPINCGAIPENLMESELFGYCRGAFSGAYEHKEGLLQLASGGTVFLDEIGDLPLPLQPKLLRCLEQKEFIPLGGTRAVKVSTRVLAASNRDLRRMVQSKEFREDLFYRLNMIEIHVPPLREHREDIPLLVMHMIPRFARELGCHVHDIDPAAMQELCMESWKGNVRELENVIQRAMILASGDVLGVRDVFPDRGMNGRRSRPLREAVREFERRTIRSAIERAGGDKRRAAGELGISLASLYAKLGDQGSRGPAADAERTPTKGS